MKKDGKYRYTLQFDDEPEAHRIVGDFLERLGNSKSPVIIEAMLQYLERHPEMAAGNTKIKVQVKQTLDWSEIESRIRKIVDEKISVAHVSGLEETGSTPMIADADIDEMLQNLDLFSQ